MASPSAGAPALKYGDVNTVTTSSGELKGLKSLDSDLKTYVNELYVIDDLIQIIECNPNVNKKILEGIKNYLTENSKTLQIIDSYKKKMLYYINYHNLLTL